MAGSFLNRLVTRLTMTPGALYNATRYALGHWRRWDAVDEALIVGAYPRDVDLPALKTLGITTIINLCEELPPHTEAISAQGMTAHHMPLLDRRAPPVETVQQALELIAEAARSGGRTYVHCRAGKGRGPTIALCHLVKQRGMTPEAAQRTLEGLRPQIDRGLHQRAVVQGFVNGGS
ncbi:MAG: dual specificity protein phosphatase family protein [Bradymonadia bacterium]